MRAGTRIERMRLRIDMLGKRREGQVRLVSVEGGCMLRVVTAS